MRTDDEMMKLVRWPDTPTDQDRRWGDYVERLQAGGAEPFDSQLERFHDIYRDRAQGDGPPCVWWPAAEQVDSSNLGRLMKEIGAETYETCHWWTLDDSEAFWEKVLDRLGVVFERRPEKILDLADGVKHPRWLAGARMNVVDSCFRAAADRVAILSGREGESRIQAVTYAELEGLVNRVAHGLGEHGLERGAAVALYMPMNVACVAAYLGVVRAGSRVVSIADSFSPPELKRRMEIASAETVVTMDRYRRGGKTVSLYDKVKEAGVPRAIVMGEDRAALRPRDLRWRDFLSSRETTDGAIADPHDIVNVLFSSGTTAQPKAIPWTHVTPLKCAMDGHFHQDIHPQDVVAWPTNVGWMMGPWLIFATLVNGATMALFEGAPTTRAFTEFIERARVTILGTVPSLVRAWRTSQAVGDEDWHHVRLLSSTGEPSNQEDYLWLMSRTSYRAPIIEYLGGTEIGGGHITGSVVQPASPATFTTPALGTDFVVLDDEGHEVEEGETGELFLVPPALGLSQMLLNQDHEESYYAGCPRGPNGEILRRHGDAIARLPRGFYKAQGRADDAMNLGGIKVSALELERVLEGHPAVYECAAAAIRSGEAGAEKLVVFVTLRDPVDETVLRRELQRRLASELNPLFRIHDLAVVDALPRTASNKLMRRELRAAYRGRE